MRLTRRRAVSFGLSVPGIVAVVSLLLVGMVQPPSVLAGSSSSSYSYSAAPVTMEVKAGFDGFYKEYSWLPVQVTLSLPAGQAAFQGRVEASFSNFGADMPVFRRNVQLTPPARKTVWLYLNGPRTLREVQVRFLADDGTVVVAPISKSIDPLGDSSLLLGVVSDDTSALNYLNTLEMARTPIAYSPFLFGQFYNYGGPNSASGSGSRVPANTSPRVSIAHLTLNDLPPNGIGWNSLDGLILGDLSNTFVGEQEPLRAAMASWLAQGAALFVAGDSALRHAPFVRSFLPVQGGDALPSPRTVSADKLTNLQKFSQNSTPLPAGNLVLADAGLNSGTGASQVLIDQDGKPLLATRPFGLGQSWFFAPELKPLRSWDGMSNFWKAVFKDYRPRENYTSAARRSYEGSYNQFNLRLTPSPQIPELPTPWWLALFLTIYVIAVGPANYIILRRLDRRELAWVTVPILTLLFSAGSYTVGNLSARGELVMSRLSIVSLGEGNDGRLTGGTDGLVGFYSNSRINFNLKVAEEALSFAVFDSDGRYSYYNGNGQQPQQSLQSLQQGPGGGFGQINMGIRAQRSFAFESDGAASEGIRARLKIVNGSLQGTLENLSDKTWDDIGLVLSGGKVQKVGSLKAGEKRQIIASPPNSTSNNNINLVQSLTGVSNYSRNSNGGSLNYNNAPYYPSNSTRPNDLASQKAITLETFFGPNGEGLPSDPGRFYLTGWRNEAKVPLSVEGTPVQNYDLTLLFESLSAD